MKKTTKYLMAMGAGMGMYALYKKYKPNMMNELKNSVNRMKYSTEKSIDNMME